MFRQLTVSGSLQALRSVHYLVHELFTDPVMLAAVSSSSSSSSSPRVSSREVHVTVGDDNAPVVSRLGFNPGQALSFGSLVSYGVLPETVRQLSDMRAYLSQQFHLELTICPEVPLEAATVLSPKRLQNSRNGDLLLPPSSPSSPSSPPPSSSSAQDTEITFLVPNTSVGAIIGVGGRKRLELEDEFGVRICVHRRDDRAAPGMRRVTLDPGPACADPKEAEASMRLCADRIKSLGDGTAVCL